MNKYVVLSGLIIAIAVSFVWFFITSTSAPFQSLFPIENYDQHLSHWIKPTDNHYDTLLLSKEKQALRYADWKRRYYGELSPWDLSHINTIIAQVSPQDVKSEMLKNLEKFSNKNKPARHIGYGVNFRPLKSEWIEGLQRNANLPQFDSLTLDPSRRAIAITNTNGRELPTDDVHFYHYSFAGEGYPFDNLQYAVVWAGTPLYVLGETLARDWVLVQTPNFRAWVKSSDIAKVDEAFITEWRRAATKPLIGITATKISIVDDESNVFWNSGYIGMVFPGEKYPNAWRILIPVRDERGQAHIHYARVPENQATAMPLPASPRQVVAILDNLIGRPYGWGGLYFYNDCASELKNLFTPFGLWLPIHSSDQVNPQLYSVKIKNLSEADQQTRQQFLMNEAPPFMTVIYVKGHVMLYLGTYANPDDPKHHPVPLSYQTVWGEEPKNPPPGKDRRSIIGGAVLLPLIPIYPEDPTLTSDLAEEEFVVGYFD